MSNCRDIDPLVTPYVDRELPEADRQAMAQVQAQRLDDWRINVDRFYLIEWNLERADPGVQFNAVRENLILLPQTLLAAV